MASHILLHMHMHMQTCRLKTHSRAAGSKHTVSRPLVAAMSAVPARHTNGWVLFCSMCRVRGAQRAYPRIGCLCTCMSCNLSLLPAALTGNIDSEVLRLTYSSPTTCCQTYHVTSHVTCYFCLQRSPGISTAKSCACPTARPPHPAVYTTSTYHLAGDS